MAITMLEATAGMTAAATARCTVLKASTGTVAEGKPKKARLKVPLQHKVQHQDWAC